MAAGYLGTWLLGGCLGTWLLGGCLGLVGLVSENRAGCLGRVFWCLSQEGGGR